MKIDGFAESYRQYIATRGGSTEDPSAAGNPPAQRPHRPRRP